MLSPESARVWCSIQGRAASMTDAGPTTQPTRRPGSAMALEVECVTIARSLKCKADGGKGASPTPR
ncbi:hypothetical protein D3C78_1799470 [compost metagenome]